MSLLHAGRWRAPSTCGVHLLHSSLPQRRHQTPKQVDRSVCVSLPVLSCTRRPAGKDEVLYCEPGSNRHEKTARRRLLRRGIQVPSGMP